MKKYTLTNDTFGSQFRVNKNGIILGEFKKLERVAYKLKRHEKWAKSAGYSPNYFVHDEKGRDITNEIRGVIKIMS
jgi:hypothetical protein